MDPEILREKVPLPEPQPGRCPLCKALMHVEVSGGRPVFLCRCPPRTLTLQRVQPIVKKDTDHPPAQARGAKPPPAA